ncbi:methyltransferase domain-containing protein [Kribbella sandramycini]|uniref:Methyltransferase domain-containing protein n=1 Tax=Kribbella sandramycini TaxID=60450 RepID=A0A7Y4P3M7_9ACTN|nr:methyltransferase domain-containing protein [Kribbella sandramycini]MBB6571625.1 trans-aconitate 2-methyltransferase [Kribbella sandramycini]NOL44270.1 methyltransferase domain-containing protein [Kribbella sandramycini]
MRTSPVWSPEQYGTYADERGRPFADLVRQIRTTDVTTVVDLGCGPGALTATLREAWPTASIVGIDSSPQMIEAAQPYADDHLSFALGDVREWTAPAASLDVIVTNATLQWVPEQLDLLPGFVQALRPGGTLAIQIPGNGNAPSHAILRELAAKEPYAEFARDTSLRPDVPGPADYVDVLSAEGCVVNAWETTYIHALQGDNAVLEWVKGTGARPVLQSLPDGLRAEFEAEYGARLAAAYPQQDYGTLLPFRRIFAVAQKR